MALFCFIKGENKMTYYHAVIEYKEDDNYIKREVIVYDQLDNIEINEKVKEFKNKTLATREGYCISSLKECRLRIFESNKLSEKFQEELNNKRINMLDVFDFRYYSLADAICYDGIGKEITRRYF